MKEAIESYGGISAFRNAAHNATLNGDKPIGYYQEVVEIRK